MVSEMSGGNVLVRSDDESVVLVILDMIVPPPQGDDTALKVVAVDDSNRAWKSTANSTAEVGGVATPFKMMEYLYH